MKLISETNRVTKAKLIGEELSRFDGVLAIVLFGSTVKGTSTPESDIDLLIVTEREMEDQLNRPLYDLMFHYDAPVEALFLTYEDLFMSLQEKSALALGILEAYQILHDKIGLEGLLSLRKKQMEEEWTYDKEAGTWIRKNLMHTLKPHRKEARDAELAFHEARYALTAFLNASAAENATSSLLVSLGAKPSRKHRNSLVLHRVLPSQPESIREDS